MASSPGESASTNPWDSFVLSTTSSQEYVDEKSLQTVASHLAADPNALELQCITSADDQSSSNASTFPLLGIEGLVPETPPAASPEWQYESSTPDEAVGEALISPSIVLDSAYLRSGHITIDSQPMSNDGTADEGLKDKTVPLNSFEGTSDSSHPESESLDPMDIVLLTVPTLEAHNQQIPLRPDFFDRIRQPTSSEISPPTILHSDIESNTLNINRQYGERLLRKRRDIQLHPFTIEKLQYKAQVGHIHDSHLSQSEIQKRRDIREKYVQHDKEFLERAAAAQKAKPAASRKEHIRRVAPNQRRQIHKQVLPIASTSKTNTLHSRTPRAKVTYKKKNVIISANNDGNKTSPLQSTQRTEVLPSQNGARRTMQQQLDLLFPEFSIDNVDTQDNDTREKRKRRRVIQDESDTDDGSVQYLGEAETIASSSAEEDSLEGPRNRSSKAQGRLDVLKERRALRGILPMSFTKVFSKELTEDEKLLQAQRRENQQRRRNRAGSDNLAKEVSGLSIATDQGEHQGYANNFTAEALNVNDIFTDDEEADGNDERNDDDVWDLEDWLGQANDEAPIQDAEESRNQETPAVLRDKDPIDRMIIRSTTSKRSGKSKSALISRTKSSSTDTNRNRVLKYSNRSPVVKRTNQPRKPARQQKSSRRSRQTSSHVDRGRQKQQRIWRFMDVKKARTSPSSATRLSQPESTLEAEDQHFKQKRGSKEDLPAWVQALLQSKNKLRPDTAQDNPQTVRPIIPSGVGLFYQSVADVTKINWWQRRGRRRPLTDTLENTEPTDVQLEQQYWEHVVDHRDESSPSSIDSDIQIINPQQRPKKSMSSKKKRKVHSKQSDLFAHHGFSKAFDDPVVPVKIRSAAPLKTHNKVDTISSSPNISSTHGPTETQMAFIRFFNDTRVFPTTFSPKELGMQWRLPKDGFIMRGFFKQSAECNIVPNASVDYNQLVTESGAFKVFGRSFNINSGGCLQDLLDMILGFFWEAMKKFQDMESGILESDAFIVEFGEFLAFVTIWLRHWVPLLPSEERKPCEDLVIKQSASFQRRILHSTKLHTILKSSDPSVSLSVSVTQMLLMWFVFSNHWEQQIGHNSFLLQCNSQLDLMQALLLWLGPEPLSTGDAISSFALEAWIYYLDKLVTTSSLDKFSTLMAHIKKFCRSDGLDPWHTAEVIWQWLFVLKEIEQYGNHEDQTKDHSQLWFAVHDLLKDTPVLNAESELSYSEMLHVTNTQCKEHVDDYIRALFSRVHQLCRLYPSPTSRKAILQLHSFYLLQRFQDLATEQDSSFPEFFIDFIGYIPHDVSPDDSCFHIFLKILCITLQQEQDATSPAMEKERRQLRRFISQLVPTHIMTIRNGDHGSYTALGNHFNLSMLFAHAVSSDIMRRSIVQAKSFLNFHESDSTARKMYFEAFTLLARIYAFHDDRDGLCCIVQLLSERLGSLVEEYGSMQARQSMAKQGFLPVDDWLADLNDRRDLIESAFIYIWKIVRDAVSVAAGWFELTSISLDQAWSCILDITTSYPDGTRLYAVNFIRSILAVRQQRVARLKDQTTHSTAQELSLSLKSSDSQDFDMFDDFDYEAIDMQIEKVYFDDADRRLAQTIKSWVLVALQSLLPHTPSDSELQQATQLAVNECQQLLNDHRM
ncbi:hypothetical protein K450DRAFT_237853 [Umbelopsis ramanniana AG]|uniref:Uncharacterized protein n=1 Tax=Umbelopsis ramanniana AG TaxID=1314678 RepID=A0AAD5HDH4_UMBRA|nr:uncharacterized protein K450DRAFT_237853 [Umbelopsis ramanniana AG]KAI8580305.1 hypothetical protein K450DRAFT_237853 [Umbelopsis ramanniana AG]